jgi:hypothetical protein
MYTEKEILDIATEEELLGKLTLHRAKELVRMMGDSRNADYAEAEISELAHILLQSVRLAKFS